MLKYYISSLHGYFTTDFSLRTFFIYISVTFRFFTVRESIVNIAVAAIISSLNLFR